MTSYETSAGCIEQIGHLSNFQEPPRIISCGQSPSDHKPIAKKTLRKCGEGSTAVASPPPNSLTETAYGAYLGLFLFWFQRGLALAAALQRLTTGSKSVSERHLSLTERPTTPESRLEKTYNCQCLALFGERRVRKRS